ncbi:DnaJ domain-containing protein [Paenibacillus sp. FSL M7-0420]|uniref:DnaJ domain-containing protein n=1 Tax=Paenibacillus sp. FSL M7-0420 TaxID=2921609 RepID=UPI0030F66BBB
MNTSSSTAPRHGARIRSKQGNAAGVNYYKLLGVRVNATQQSIKAAYVAKIKEFPPERYPEEFQNIRKAYDALRDPARRAEYDFTRKYGDSVEGILYQAGEAFASGDYLLAEELYLKALETHPGHSGAGVSLSMLYLADNKLSAFNRVWKGLESHISTPRDMVTATLVKFRILIDYERMEKALSVMRSLDKKYRSWRRLFIMDYADILIYNGLKDEAWRLFEETAEELDEEPDKEIQAELAEETLNFYIHWTLLMFHVNKMQFWNKLKQRIRAYLRSLPEGEEREQAVEQLLEQSRVLSDSNAYKEALTFADLAYYTAPKNQEVLEQRSQAQAGTKLILEIDRLMRDKQIYPGIKMQAVSFFKDEILRKTEGEAEEMDNALLPMDLIDGLGGPGTADYFMEEGIRQMKRKYPQVYKVYQKQWDKLLG